MSSCSDLKIAIDSDGNTVSIDEANNSKDYICSVCNQIIIPVKGEKISWHFRHKVDIDIRDTITHKKAQDVMFNILNKKLPVHIIQRCRKCNIDIEWELDCNEFENSEVRTEYTFDYNGPKRADVALVSGNNIPDLIFEIKNTSCTKEENRPGNECTWFEFKALDVIEVSYEGSIRLLCNRQVLCERCIIPGNITRVQQGAGTGKTYNAVQLIITRQNTDNFIFMSQRHSVKDVIYQEFTEQQTKGKLHNLKFQPITNECNHIGCNNQASYAKIKWYEPEYCDSHKPDCYVKIKTKFYKLLFTRVSNGNTVQIIICTVDSFVYRMTAGKDMKPQIVSTYPNDFLNRAKTIATGVMINKEYLTYGDIKIPLNRKSLFIVDEGQDLHEEYYNAYSKISETKGVDFNIIGDKLQGLTLEKNIFTLNNIKTTTFDNICRRFHHPGLMELVNRVVLFDKYNLPKISGICDGNNCGIDHSKLDSPPWEYFPFDRRDLNFDYIKKKMEYEIEKFEYLPEDFMFIIPVVNGGEIPESLNTFLSNFWIEKIYNDDKYNKIISENEYWKEQLDKKMILHTCELHKATEGGAIDLSTSVRATQILSIHAAKGSGRKVVFLIGMSENTLKMFSLTKDSIKYESLVHVALTRQKCKLYIGLGMYRGEYIDDDIYRRITGKDSEVETLDKFRTSSKLTDIIRYATDSKYWSEIQTLISEDKNVILSAQEENDAQNDTVDQYHHIIRYRMIFYKFITQTMCFTNHETLDTNQQYIQKLIEFMGLEIRELWYIDYFKYMKILKTRIFLNKESQDYKKSITKHGNYLPIFRYKKNNKNLEYEKYPNIIIEYIGHIQGKLKISFKNSKFPLLCPLEILILMFAVETFYLGTLADIDIITMFRILYFWERSKIDHSSTDYECMCDKFIHTKESINNNSIGTHYKTIESIDKLVDEFKNTYIGKKSIPYYNTFYNLSFYNDNFSLTNRYSVISYNKPSGGGDDDSDEINYFLISPQLNMLNIDIQLLDVLLNLCIIPHTKKCYERNKYKRYGKGGKSKNYNARILTLNNKLISLQSNDQQQKLSYNIIHDYFIEKFKKYNLILMEHCKPYIEEYFNTPKIDGQNVMIYIHKKLNDWADDKWKENKSLTIHIPDYALKVLIKKSGYIEGKIEDDEEVNEQLIVGKLLEYLNKGLEKSVKEFLDS